MVEGCQGRAASQTSLWVHFVHPVVRETLVILEEGNYPHLRLTTMDFFLWEATNSRHPNTALCPKGEEKKCYQMTEDDTWEGVETTLQAYVLILTKIASLK